MIRVRTTVCADSAGRPTPKQIEEILKDSGVKNPQCVHVAPVGAGRYKLLYEGDYPDGLGPSKNDTEKLLHGNGYRNIVTVRLEMAE